MHLQFFQSFAIKDLLKLVSSCEQTDFFLQGVPRFYAIGQCRNKQIISSLIAGTLDLFSPSHSGLNLVEVMNKNCFR